MGPRLQHLSIKIEKGNNFCTISYYVTWPHEDEMYINSSVGVSNVSHQCLDSVIDVILCVSFW